MTNGKKVEIRRRIEKIRKGVKNLLSNKSKELISNQLNKFVYNIEYSTLSEKIRNINISVLSFINQEIYKEHIKKLSKLNHIRSKLRAKENKLTNIPNCDDKILLKNLRRQCKIDKKRIEIFQAAILLLQFNHLFEYYFSEE